MTTMLGVACAGVLLALSLLALYEWVLAVAALLPSRTNRIVTAARSRFLVLVPAHDEEAGLPSTLVSLGLVDYDLSRLRVVVVADRCEDATAAVARRCGAECLERLDGPPGKGAAIAWAVDHLRASGCEFDGLVIVDADTIVDRRLLEAFDERLRAGDEVQQGYNYLSNPWESPFTRIIAVTSVLRNALFYGGKERVGLSAMLSGTGMCFSRRIIDCHRWTAFSVGEDWEFSVSLLLAGERIHFNSRARVFAAESRNFRQASTQRLRWASGRQLVAGASTIDLFRAGLRLRRPDLWDAGITMLAPTYSAQATLALLCLSVSWYLSQQPGWDVLFPWAAVLTGVLAAYFVAGVVRTEAPARALAGIVLIPVFLPWRAAIEILGLFGYGRARWVRTSRAAARTIVAALAVAPFGAGGMDAEAQVLFKEDFEQADIEANGFITLWDGPANILTMYPTGDVAHSGRRALELKYVPATSGASYMYKLFAGQDQIYVRWYQRWSPGFIWEPSATKMTILRPMGGYPQFYPEVLWGNGQLAVQAQVIAEANWDSRNFYQNVGEPIVFEHGRWYCIEVFVRLNTPGEANGAIAAWIDGELKLDHTGREFRGETPLDPAPSTAKIEAVGLTGYYGGLTPVPQLQFAWQDDIVGSLQPIGMQLLSDDLEASTTFGNGSISGWDGPARPSVMRLTDRRSHSGTHSLEMEYTAGSSGAGYMYKHFMPQEHVYLRWYQRWSADFVWEPSSTGLVGLRPASGYPHFYPLVLGGTGQLAIQAQVLADRGWGTENFVQNVGDPVAFEPSRWYCVEVGIRLNTPGVPDGSLSAWIDGEQKLLYEGREFRGANPDDPAPSTARLAALLIAAQYGGLTPVPHLQFSWQDDHVASTQRVGCEPFAPILP